jgi:hypothetical protein
LCLAKIRSAFEVNDIRRGYVTSYMVGIRPKGLNLEGKNRAFVGLGTYIVNTEGCNDCHSAGPPTEYVRGGNPFFGQPKKVNPATYLGGGRDFGELAVPPVGSAHIISRNLTPTPKTGLPEGDHTFAEFLEIIRHGTDFDNLHPACTGAPNSGYIPKPFDGALLQIMPWPNFKHLTDHDIRAIYAYLKAVPCVQGNHPGPGGPEANIHLNPQTAAANERFCEPIVGYSSIIRQPSSVRAASRLPSPLRTGRESFPSPGSSPANASLRETRFRNVKTLTMNPIMALGMK